MAIKWYINRLPEYAPSTATGGFYPRVDVDGEVTLEELADEIQARCGVSLIDVKNILNAIEEIVPEKLREGKKVDLGLLYLKPSLKSVYGTSNGNKPGDVTVTAIKRAKINVQLKRNLVEDIDQDVTFQKVNTRSEKVKAFLRHQVMEALAVVSGTPRADITVDQDITTIGTEAEVAAELAPRLGVSAEGLENQLTTMEFGEGIKSVSDCVSYIENNT